MILFKNKKIISFLVASILVLSFSVCAYADDPEDFDSSGDSDVVTNEMIDSELQSIANNLYQIQLLNDSRATTYTATDIYNFMVNHFLMGGAQNGYMYQIYSFVTSLNTKVQAIMTYANSIREYTELIHDNITGDNTPITLYDLIGDHLGNIANMLGVTEGNTTLSAAELLLLINNTIDDSYLALGNIQTTLDSIQNNIALLYAVMTDIAESNNDIVTQTTTMNANMQTMIARLQSMQNDFNNITWLNSTSSYLGYKLNFSDSDYLTDQRYISGGNSVYLFYNNFYATTNNVYKISIRIRPSTNYLNNYFIKNITFIRDNGNTIPGNYSYVYDANAIILNIYFYDGNLPDNTICIKLDFNSTGILYGSSNQNNIYYINSDSLDYYFVYYYLSMNHQNNIFKKFEMLYASDDLIAAKENQQSYEDQAIQDFTGSGSASASLSDLGGLKSVSSAFKSGLDSGASVSNALSIFSSNSGFWGWFSQSNYNDINNLSNSGSNTRSGNNIQESIVDYYSDNMFSLLYLLQNSGD